MCVLSSMQIDGVHVEHAAMLASTCYVQLLLAGCLLTLIIAALLHQQFWEMVRDTIWWLVSIAFIILWHILAQQLLNRYVTDGKCIKRPFVWIFSYVALSAGYCTVRLPEEAISTEADNLFVSMKGISGFNMCDARLCHFKFNSNKSK
jgi:hypothetical protein